MNLPVDIDWLVKLLNHQCGEVQEEQIIKPAGYGCEEIGDKKGFLSTVYKVSFKWEKVTDIGLPASVILKIPTETKIKGFGDSFANSVFHDGTLLEAHNRECQAYKYFNSAPAPPIPMPKCYFFGERVLGGDNGLLVLEDVSDGRALKYDEDLTLEQFMVFAGHIARLQAAWFNTKDPGMLISATKHNVFMDLMETLEGGLDALILDVGDRFPWEKRMFLDHVEKRKKETMLLGNPTLSGHTPVLSLGDMQPNNLFWSIDTEDTSRVTTNIRAFMDFQMVHVGYCMMDFCCPLIFMLPTDVRRSNLDQIVDHYLHVLRQNTHGECPITRVEAMYLVKRLAWNFAALEICLYETFFATIAKVGGERVKYLLIDRMIAILADYW